VAVEDPFVGKSARAALALGQARGVLLLAAGRAGIPVASYEPRLVKSSVVGNGGASKEQVQFMVQRLLGLKEPPMPLDTSDALAVALCHLNRRKLQLLK
ncbi:crossover junction endodeoxyribonuclease RuvC, partial [bacterium]|nr:crossover junction endodeoxyribonuclease RuvC [bacterium]